MRVGILECEPSLLPPAVHCHHNHVPQWPHRPTDGWDGGLGLALRGKIDERLGVMAVLSVHINQSSFDENLAPYLG